MPCWDPLQFTPGLQGRDPRPAIQREISDQQPAGLAEARLNNSNQRPLATPAARPCPGQLLTYTVWAII